LSDAVSINLSKTFAFSLLLALGTKALGFGFFSSLVSIEAIAFSSIEESLIDLITTLQDLAHWGVSVIAPSGLQFDLTTPQGKLIASVMASLAEFERDLVRERVCSGLAAAKAKGKKLGRKPGQRFKSERYTPKVLQMVSEGHSYRQIAHELHLSKTTVNDIVKRDRENQLKH
jgi:putative DNA-invertase from lambdoid prophage Rac